MATDRREALRHAIAYEHRLFQEVRKHEQVAARWQQRANLALRRGEHDLAGEALQRAAAESRLAEDWQAQYLAQSDAVRRAKRGLRQAALSAPPDPAEARLAQLAQEDRLERDLADLKAKLAG
jgi:phage shock protein A